MNTALVSRSADADGPEAAAPIVLSGIHKHYGGVRALRGADFRMTRQGVVHALLGANGCGKSTLLGILSGQVAPDDGTMTIYGRTEHFHTPADAIARGIVMVSQETHVAPDLSVTENILLGRRLVRTSRGIDWRASRARAAEILDMLALDYRPDAVVRDLRANQRQMVEIARAVSMDARVLILDEPTSSLSDDEVTALFAVLRRLTASGVAIIFVSHRLPEVKALADEVTVMRNGQAVAAGPLAQFDTDRLIHAITGDALEALGAHHHQRAVGAPHAPEKTPRLTVRGLEVERAVSDVSLEVAPSEIVGLAGLEGSGRSEVLQAVFGVIAASSGEVAVDGKALSALTPREAMASGIAYLPPERRNGGLVLPMSIEANLQMVAARDARRLGRPSRFKLSRAALEQYMTQMRLHADSLDVPVGTLSGGNQQKVAIAKWLLADPTLLLLEEPTRGVDIGAKAEIHRLLRDQAEQGLGILITSAEPEELLSLCDRIVVMFRGRVVASLAAGEASESAIARHASGH